MSNNQYNYVGRYRKYLWIIRDRWATQEKSSNKNNKHLDKYNYDINKLIKNQNNLKLSTNNPRKNY